MAKKMKMKMDARTIMIILLLLVVVGLAIGWAVHVTEQEKKNKKVRSQLVNALMNE
jgi:hypothetical protein